MVEQLLDLAAQDRDGGFGKREDGLGVGVGEGFGGGGKVGVGVAVGSVVDPDVLVGTEARPQNIS